MSDIVTEHIAIAKLRTYQLKDIMNSIHILQWFQFNSQDFVLNSSAQWNVQIGYVYNTLH